MLRECEREIRFRILARVSRGGFNNHRPWKAVREEQANVKLQNTNQKDELRRRRRRGRIYYCLIVVLCLHDMAQQRVHAGRQAGVFRFDGRFNSQLNSTATTVILLTRYDHVAGGRTSERASKRSAGRSQSLGGPFLSLFFLSEYINSLSFSWLDLLCTRPDEVCFFFLLLLARLLVLAHAHAYYPHQTQSSRKSLRC